MELNGNMEPNKESGLGDLLRNEREKKGLSREQVARTTRLRKHYLEALENEDWDNLPSPVFVKGFIRSYAQAVGFDGKEAISLYDRIVPIEEEIPKPLIGLKEPKRNFLFFLIPLIVVIALVAYLWVSYETPVSDKKEDVSINLAKEDVKEPAPVEEQDLSLADKESDVEFEVAEEPERLSVEEDLPLAPVESCKVFLWHNK